MGAKTGYSKAILSIMGLRAGQGAQRYVWAEPDDTESKVPTGLDKASFSFTALWV